VAKKAAFPRVTSDLGSRSRMKHESVTREARNKSLRFFHFDRFVASVTNGGRFEP